MLYIPKIGDYLKIFTNEEVKDFVATNFCECFKSIRQKLYSKLNKKQNFRKNAKLMITIKLKELLSEWKKFKIQAILVLDYKKRNNHSSAKLIAGKSLHYDKNK